MDNESGIFAMTFDQSGSRLITTEADKTIKIYREDDTAVSNIDNYSMNSLFYVLVVYNLFVCFQTEESHPIHWRPEILKRRKY